MMILTLALWMCSIGHLVIQQTFVSTCCEPDKRMHWDADIKTKSPALTSSDLRWETYNMRNASPEQGHVEQVESQGRHHEMIMSRPNPERRVTPSGVDGMSPFYK